MIVTAGTIAPGDDRHSAVPAEVFQRLEFTKERADQIEALLREQFRFDVERLDEAEAAHLAAIHGTRPEAVSVFHFIGHGTAKANGLHFVATDRNFDQNTNLSGIVGHLNMLQTETDGHHYLLVLDMCEAGKGLGKLTFDEADNIWILCATGTQATYDGQFSRSLAEVLAIIDVDESEPFIPMDRLWRETCAHFRLTLLDRWCADRTDLDEQGVKRLRSRLPVPRRLGRFMVYADEEPPFFPNPRFAASAVEERSARKAIDVRLHPFLDAPHFADRVGAHFTGRATILASIGAWRTERDSHTGLYLLSGAAGSGKSTVLGAAVLTSHPDIIASEHYDDARERLFHRLPESCALPVLAPVAAVHARQRQLEEVVQGFIDQLADQGALEPEEVGTVTDLVGWAALQAEPPIFILDALDEALRPEDLVHVLLRPLLTARRNGRPASRVLVACRNDTDRNREMLRLLEQTAAAPVNVNLNEIDPEEARGDLAAFLADTLRTDQDCCRSGVKDSAAAMAAALVERTDRRQYGMFLTASLYASHLIRQLEHVPGRPETHLPTSGDRIAAEVPASLPEVLELDFRSVEDPEERRRRRAVMAALAHAHGQGMPATVAELLAKEVFGGGELLEATEILHDSTGIKVYLRSATDPSDGAPLYRLFHQSLTDHLRSHPITAEGEFRQA